MKVVLSWLKDFVDIRLSPVELARKLTMIGLEVEEIQLIGLAPDDDGSHDFKVIGLSWDPERVVVAQIDEIMPHPNADRLVLCRLQDGTQEHIVLTGAPNLFEYRGKGQLTPPLKVAYAKEGARIYDGHQEGQVLTTLKRAKIRGVDSYSMVCSEKELGISEEHEGILLFDAAAPTGMSLAEYMGDAVFDVNILPNMIRNASMLGIARELAAVTGEKLRKPDMNYTAAGADMADKAKIVIREPELNPRFVLGMISGVEARPSPLKVQNRLRLAGMRPINSVVDATNYVMLEIGQPLHAFDYDVLLQRAHGQPPTILTRRAAPGEKLTTLDGEERTLNDFSVLVCDEAGSLSIAGVMGGQESEVTPHTHTVLLEGAAWNYMNIRRTITAQHFTSEAAFRFSRGIHPAMASEGVRLGLKYMLEWSGGEIAQGLIDNYPLPYADPTIPISEMDVRRNLGVTLTALQIAGLLEGLEFACQVDGQTVYATAPAHRIDIGEGLIGRADLLEEIARMVGYDNIPATRLRDVLPVQHGNPALEKEQRIRETLAGLGLMEVINYRLTTPEREARILPEGSPTTDLPYVRLANPMTPERAAMRRSLLASVVETAERNIRLSERVAMFELGPVFLPELGDHLPAEPRRLAVVMSGLRQLPSWDTRSKTQLDFYDLKGIIEALLDELHLPKVRYAPAESASFHPGKCAGVYSGETLLGTFGELHPRVKENYDFLAAPVLAAELDLDAIMAAIPPYYISARVPTLPPILEDIAVVVEEDVPNARVEEVIRMVGGKLVTAVRLFDVFRSEQIGAGKKSLAYSLTYQSPDHTLTDQEVGQTRQKIIRRLDQELGAKLRA